MPQFILPESPADEFREDDWSEDVDNVRPGGPIVFTNEGAEGVLVGQIPANKKRSAHRKILGYSIADAASLTLRRPEVPWVHPEFSTLYAESIGFQDHTPARNPTSAENYPRKSSIDPGPFSYTGYYKGCEATVRFKELACALYRDTDTPLWNGKEWSRFVTLREMRSKLETKQLDRSATPFYYAETGPGGPPSIGAPATGSPPGTNALSFSGSTVLYEYKTEYVLEWLRVEESFVMTGTAPMLVAKKLDLAQGTVNSTPFPGPNGHPAGTLLFGSWTSKRKEVPIRTNTYSGLFCHDITISLSKFDPVRGAATTPTSPRGWNLMPYKESLKYYLATRGAGAGLMTGTPLLRSTDFHDVFTHVLAP